MFWHKSEVSGSPVTCHGWTQEHLCSSVPPPQRSLFLGKASGLGNTNCHPRILSSSTFKGFALNCQVSFFPGGPWCCPCSWSPTCSQQWLGGCRKGCPVVLCILRFVFTFVLIWTNIWKVTLSSSRLKHQMVQKRSTCWWPLSILLMNGWNFHCSSY